MDAVARYTLAVLALSWMSIIDDLILHRVFSSDAITVLTQLLGDLMITYTSGRICQEMYLQMNQVTFLVRIMILLYLRGICSLLSVFNINAYISYI